MTGVKLMLTRLVQVPANTEFETYNIRDETTIASRLENRENDETEKLKKKWRREKKDRVITSTSSIKAYTEFWLAQWSNENSSSSVPFH